MSYSSPTASRLEAGAPALIANSDSLREAFGKTLSALGDEFPKLVVLDADIAGGTGVHHFRKSHPERLIQFGIAEQNMMAAAGGMAAVGPDPGGHHLRRLSACAPSSRRGCRSAMPGAMPRSWPAIPAWMSVPTAARPRRWKIWPPSAPFPA